MQTTIDIAGTQLELRSADEPEAVNDGWLLAAGPVEITHPFGATAFYRHGWHSWSPTRWVMLDQPARTAQWSGPQNDDPDLLDTERHIGCWVGALDAGSGNVLLLGSLGLDARVEADTETLSGHGDTTWFLAHGPEAEVFARYAARLGEHLGSRANDPGRVWCSWYSFYTGISEPEIDEVLEGVAGLPFDVFQIDDGWQRHIGDWTVNEKFPTGMAALAGRIDAAGYRPGLWIAPFIAHEGSELFATRPELFLHDETGAPVVAGNNWGGPYYPLDVTLPEACEVVGDIIREACGWGFTYLKLDFLFAAALPGVRTDGTSREQAYRRGIEVIRDAAGDDTYLLACGSPILPSIGVFDGMRIGPDVAPWWQLDIVPEAMRDLASPSTRYAISTSLHRLWLETVIAVDPDVAYFRTRYDLLTDDQRLLLQDLVHICNFFATSDPPAWLDEQERANLHRQLASTPTVERLDRYRFRLDGREVDFRGTVLDHPAAIRLAGG